MTEHVWKQTAWEYDDSFFVCQNCNLKTHSRRGLPPKTEDECRAAGIRPCDVKAVNDRKANWFHSFGVCSCCVDGCCPECGETPEELCACRCPDKWRAELEAAQLRIEALEGGIVAENARVVREHNELRAEIEDLKGLLAPRVCKHCGCEPAVVVTYCNELESDDVCPDCENIPQPHWHPNALDNPLPEWCASAVSRFCRALAGRKIERP